MNADDDNLAIVSLCVKVKPHKDFARCSIHEILLPYSPAPTTRWFPKFNYTLSIPGGTDLITHHPQQVDQVPGLNVLNF